MKLKATHHITCHDIEYRRVVLQFLIDNGWKLPVHYPDIDIFLKNFGHCFNLIVYKDGGIGCNSCQDADIYTYVSFEDLVKMVKTPQKEIEFQISAEYVARYIQGENFVSVGCQKILISKIRELLKMIDGLTT